MNPKNKSSKTKFGLLTDFNFHYGEVKMFYMKPYLDIGIFKELQNPEIFNSVKPLFGSVTTKNGQDLLYLESKEVK